MIKPFCDRHDLSIYLKIASLYYAPSYYFDLVLWETDRKNSVN